MASSQLASFHPVIRQWFNEKRGVPTEVQEKCWPTIRQGKHILATAPTGSGKTLAAFLAVLDDFVSRRIECGATRVVYVSPLKALNNDIQQNLLGPISDLKKRLSQQEVHFPDIRVLVRSGDSSASERQRMLRNPPEILITTPESLMLLLTTTRGRKSLCTAQLVVLDEIHAVIESRRGAQLLACLERLVDIAGEIQRIALSATITPLQRVADYVGGIALNGETRTVEHVVATTRKDVDLKIKFPPDARAALQRTQPIWPSLHAAFRGELEDSASTLFFCNSRRQAERITTGINEEAQDLVAYAHHGSLSREIRVEVEQRLKAGELDAIVATNSLELGIDIGHLEKVVLIQCPPSVASTVQRIGRAGHQVGEVSRCVIYPTHARDFIDAAALAKAVNEQNIEPIEPIEGPLDLLAQLIVSMVASENRTASDLFETLRRSGPYRALERSVFDLVIHMLAGKYEKTRVRDLKPRIAVDDISGLVQIRKGATFALYTSGGTIPDRGYYQIKTSADGSKVGELDEEFVWEASIGDTFAFGTQTWVIDRITHNDVLVKPASSATVPPFWRSEAYDRSFHFSDLVSEVVREGNEALNDDQDISGFEEKLKGYGFDNEAIKNCIEFMHAQREATRCDLPHTQHVVAEVISTGPAGYRSAGSDGQLVLHTGWGGQVNRPIAYAMQGKWKKTFASEPDFYVDNQVIAMQLTGVAHVDSIFQLIEQLDLAKDLRSFLEQSSFFAARFRECAGRALLLSKRNFKHRMPLWMTRMNAQKLQTAVSEFVDFPILLETWRTCLDDEFDMDKASELLEAYRTKDLAFTVIHRDSPSPFASEIVYDQVNTYMYRGDEVERRVSSNLSKDLIEEVLRNSGLRPAIEAATIDDVEARLQRRLNDYVPTDELELKEWIKTRVWIPEDEWFESSPVPVESRRIAYEDRVWITYESEDDNQDLIDRQIETALQFYGPRPRDVLLKLFPFSSDVIGATLDKLAASGKLITDIVVEQQSGSQSCDVDNLARLLRWQRKQARPNLPAMPISRLTPFLAAWHDFGASPTEENIVRSMDIMRGYAAPVNYWFESAWLARIPTGDPRNLYDLLRNYDIAWQGVKNESIRFDLASRNREPTVPPSEAINQVLHSFQDKKAAYTFEQLLDVADVSAGEFNACFWQAVWGGFIASQNIHDLDRPRAVAYQLSAARRGKHRYSRHLTLRKSSGLWQGLWYVVDSADDTDSEIDLLEARKEDCRILLSRYGVVTREIANREGDQYRWSRLFNVLRLMELSGELLAGRFFEALSGPQFATREAVANLEADRYFEGAFWISAMDPIASSGLGLRQKHIPARRQGSYLGYAYGNLLATATRGGQHLHLFDELDTPGMSDLLSILPDQVGHGRALRITEINGSSALYYPDLEPLKDLLRGHLDYQGVYLSGDQRMSSTSLNRKRTLH